MSVGKRGDAGHAKGGLGRLLKPSTHIGIYMSGIGGGAGALGGLVKGLWDAAYADGPGIAAGIADGLAGGPWDKALYHGGAALAKVALTTAYATAGGWFIGYTGGSRLTDSAMGYVSSIFGRGRG
jgi:hypothetical protein